MKFPIGYLVIIAVLFPIFTAQANCRSNPRSLAEMETEATSGHQPQPGNRRSRPLKQVDFNLTPPLEAGTIKWGFQKGRASPLVVSGDQTPLANSIDCFSGEAEFVASVQGRRFSAPCRFIRETTEQLKKILESEGAKQPFALEVDHAHLAVTSEIWDEKYRDLRPDEILPVVLRDTSLVAIYHSTCHTPIADRKTAGTTARELNKKRHFLGFYDGRTMANLPYRKPGSEQTEGQYYRPFAWFYISAHKSAELVLSAKGQSVAFDIFFDDDHAAAPVPDIVNVSTRAK